MPESNPPRKRAAARRRAIVLATPKGEVQFADATARRWLKQFFGRPKRAGLLPPRICRWLRVQGERSAVAKQRNARLFVAKQKSSTEQTTLLLLELVSGKVNERFRRHRALTQREGEVVLWLRRGKSNSEIAEILGIKAATVSKHLEHIYPKLGVENRTAAANLDLQDRQLLN
jgi:DNA-binding CsgD family transcriptional regulator